MHPCYVPSIEPRSQADLYYKSVILMGTHGPEARLAGIETIDLLCRGHDHRGQLLNLGDRACTLAEWRGNIDFRWVIPSAEWLVHPVGIDDGCTPQEVATRRAWRETHIWLLLTAGGVVASGRFAPTDPRGWQVLVAMLEVTGFMTGQRPSPPRTPPGTPVRIWGMLDMGLRR